MQWYDLPLLRIYPKETKSLPPKVVCTRMFTEALLTTAKIWQQPKLSINWWMVKENGKYDVYTHTHAHICKRRNIIQPWKRNIAICDHMDEAQEHCSKWSKSDKDI